ncbi:EAL domain-containing protein [Microvirga mediterraneensis]|uniref:EAL domain-containing protein n=1 Tax=Microvirga mediterraneensis TaxID=2754695 RepID=A0A838BU53_9HYPH|nr:EAL domain-containing protein [Microvirga mediterraneensis]MBA1158443.1 EAL domain-containing protein [Microvirga mediterraneensis]
MLAFTPAFLMAVASAYVPMEAGIILPVFGFLIMAVFFGLVVLWWHAETDRQARAVQPAAYEQAEPARAAPLVLRPPVRADSPVSVLRELAMSAGAQVYGADPGPGRSEQVKAAHFPEPSLLPSMRRPSTEEIDRVRQVNQAFEADRIELHLQPVVSLPQQKIRFYEALARLRLPDGTLLRPAEFLPIVEASGHASDFDRRVLVRTRAVARHLVARGSEAIVGVNLTAHSIAEPGFLWSLARLFDASPDLLGKIVLEMSQQSWRCLDADHRAALAALRERGVPFSLDRAADLRFDPARLADLGIRFMKLPADLMIEAAERADGRYAGPEPDVRDFAPALRRQGILLIADRVEEDGMVPILCDLGVPLAQGFAFAAPRPVKPEIAAEQPVRQSPVPENTPSLLRHVG